MKARDLMTSDHVWACSETADVREVAQMMADHDVGAIPVLDPQGRLEGIVTDRDLCCRILARGMSFETPVRRVMSGDVRTVRPDADLREIEQAMAEHKIRRMPVVDEDNRLQGFIAQADLLRACAEHRRQEHGVVETLETISEP